MVADAQGKDERPCGIVLQMNLVLLGERGSLLRWLLYLLLAHFITGFGSNKVFEQVYLLCEELKHNHGSLNITQADKTALIL